MLLLALSLTQVASDAWRVEKLADVRNPTAVAVAPDGRVFVGEDPMDMEGPVDARLGRVLEIHEGRTRVFADKLGPVFGLAWHDGRLYVHDCHRVAAYKEGVEPVEILPATHPNPSGGNRYNTHIPAGIKMSSDGWFYMAVGDKGIPGIPRPDGSVFRFKGGGVVRFKPDGGALESFATGTRNIMDVAITPAGEIYAFDNDDNAAWGARVLRVRKGDDFGYPWDRGKPWAAPALHEARGIPAGCGAFGDDVLLCDWGRSKVVRYRFDAKGIVGREDLFTKGADEFRPVCVATSDDSVYVTDWATPARRVKMDVGRVWRFTRLKPLPPPAAFTGHAPPRAPSDADEVHRLSRRFFKEAPWDGGWWGGRPALSPKPFPTVEHEETPLIRARLRAMLVEGEPVVRAAAAEGLAQDPVSLDLLRERLPLEEHPKVRRTLFDALRGALDPAPLLDDPVLFEDACRLVRDPAAVARAIEKADPSRLPPLLAAVGRVGPATSARSLLGHKDPRVVAAAVDALGALRDQASIPELIKLGAVGALIKMPDARAEALYRTAMKGRQPELRLGAYRALQQLRLDPEPWPAPPPLPLAGGDGAKGRELFRSVLGCVRCHLVGAEGGDIGPELTMVGAVYSRLTLSEHILFPEKIVHGAYRQHVLRLKSGAVVSGVLRRETSDAITLGDAEGTSRSYAKSEVEARRMAESSIMPAGLADGLSGAEFADLLAYLESLKGEE